MGITLLLVSFLGGIFTVLAPCTLPLLPVIVGSGTKHRSLVVVTSFASSVFVFSLIINWVTKNLGISQGDITFIAGLILIIFGLLMLFPQPRQKFAHKIGLDTKSSKIASKTKKNFAGDIILGVVLGPILQSCSPTYGILIATILPGSFLWGVANILSFVLGMSLLLILIIYGGKKMMQKLRRVSNPNGIARKIVATLIIVTGIMVSTGFQTKIGVWLNDTGLILDTTEFEYNLLNKTNSLPTN